MTLSISLVLLTGFLALALLHQFHRLADLRNMQRDMSERVEAKKRGSDKAQLQYPQIDLSRCLGCGTCVRACPEEGVLGLIHGQAAVLHGARCMGHGLCAKECPVEAIVVTLGDIQDRKDIPALTGEFEVVGVSGLFLCGEVTGHALIRTAIAHGKTIADEIAGRISSHPQNGSGDVLDLCIVGAGPAGFSCSLQAKARGLRFVTLEQETLGGTVAKYPRRKLVMMQPVELPLYGMLKRAIFEKEDLVAIWEEAARRHRLPLKTGVEFKELEKDPAGHFIVKTTQGQHRARFVVLALGRRGSPRKLGVPGEELPKVAYNLIDAESYRGRHILVVGGGDSAIEAALALSQQPDNCVSLSYRQAGFFRLKARNEKGLKEAAEKGRIDLILESQVLDITPEHVRVQVKSNGSPAEEWTLPNDDVFVMAGGIPPFALLEKAGVSFDPAKVPPPPRMVERGTDVAKGIIATLLCVAAAWLWYALFKSYYALPEAQRVAHAMHDLLRASGPIGLAFGILATSVILTNLLYLPRRAFLGSWIPGSLRAWMTCHLATGIVAFLLVLFHAGMMPRGTVGGYAFYTLGVLAITGAIGRYFYTFVPRAANGQETAMEKLRNELAALSAEWDRRGRGFGEQAQQEIRKLVESATWGRGFFRRVFSLLRDQRLLRATLRRLRERGKRDGLSTDQIRELSSLVVRAHRTALGIAYYEHLRGLLGSWRYLHRWVALVMALLVVVHIMTALHYANLF
ncbi:MAG: NAD(P)-binding domain-containing protein [Planctomycetes bacterium]|nr:NAD(P)-binding domain-containing protein [Planctomycetota bacterium]